MEGVLSKPHASHTHPTPPHPPIGEANVLCVLVILLDSWQGQMRVIVLLKPGVKNSVSSA